jgi:hypothetical protein
MKLNRLETHDRLGHFKEDQAINIFKGAEDCLKKNRLSIGLQQYSPYLYIFAHPRTADDGVTKRMLWQPRLTKPKSQTNSYLFRVISNTDQLEICWLLPPREMWAQYFKGKVTEYELVIWSINQFLNHRNILDTPDPEDLNDERVRQIYITVATEIDQENKMEKIYGRKDTQEFTAT